MKKFVFPLERVLAWRRLECEKEEAVLERLRADRARLLARKEELIRELHVTSRRLLGAATVASEDLCFLEDFRDYARHAGQNLERKMALADLEIGRQLDTVKEARRAYRLIEKLREKKWREWEAGYDRELEQQAGEIFLARWSRDARQVLAGRRTSETGGLPGGGSPSPALRRG